MPRRTNRALSAQVLLAILALPVLGCQSAMTTTQQKASNGIVQNELPLRFKSHAFNARCYSTYGCKVLYANNYHVMDDDDHLSPPWPGEAEKKHWENGSQLGIDNFPPPAIVTWRSKDGSTHEAHIDLGQIFKDQLVLHRVSQEELPTETIAMPSEPHIYVIVDDRTISVYMQATIALKEPRIPGNPYSNFRDDVVLAYSRTY